MMVWLGPGRVLAKSTSKTWRGVLNTMSMGRNTPPEPKKKTWKTWGMRLERVKLGEVWEIVW